MDGIDELGDDIPGKSDFHDAFRGTVKFDIRSWDSEVGLFAAFADFPLGYDTIRIDVKATDGKRPARKAINRLIFRCSSTLECSMSTSQTNDSVSSAQFNLDPSCLTRSR